MADTRLCSIPDCGKSADRRGLCTAHYMRQRRNGDPTAGRCAPGSRQSFLEKVVKGQTDECVLWPFPIHRKTGYGMAKINGVAMTAHRAALCLATGETPHRNVHAAHAPELCHNRACVNPRHLRWATPTENNADKLIDGTQAEGTAAHRAILTEPQVRLIRNLPLSDARKALMLNVSEATVRQARIRQTYRNIK